MVPSMGMAMAMALATMALATMASLSTASSSTASLASTVCLGIMESMASLESTGCSGNGSDLNVSAGTSLLVSTKKSDSDYQYHYLSPQVVAVY